MKTILKAVLILLSIFSVFYLLGAFYSASLIISQWNVTTRFFVSLFGGLISILSTIVFLFFPLNKGGNK